LCARSTRPFSGARIGTDDVNVERSPAKLGHAVTTKGAWMVDPEDTVLVAVEGDRLAQASKEARAAWK
jgi:hypothetical protein